MHLMQPSNHGLKRELKVTDLVLMQILVIVSLNISGYAAKQGRSQVVLWLLAMALFYLPQGAIVIWLSRVIPLEGGVYQWVKQGFSPFAGCMAGWTDQWNRGVPLLARESARAIKAIRRDECSPSTVFGNSMAGPKPA